MICFYYLYKNLKTGALLWSKKAPASENPVNHKKWTLIGDYSTWTEQLVLYADSFNKS